MGGGTSKPSQSKTSTPMSNKASGSAPLLSDDYLDGVMDGGASNTHKSRQSSMSFSSTCSGSFSTACSASDPMQWTASELENWLGDGRYKPLLHSSGAAFAGMDGEAVCFLTRMAFRELVEKGGGDGDLAEECYQDLRSWRMNAGIER